jgi:hypothetical protein
MTMKKKIALFASIALVLALGLFYTQSNILIADDKDGKKDCSSSCTEKTGSSSAESKSSCTSKTMSGKSTGDDKSGYAVYEFTTDAIHCDGCKPGMTEKIKAIGGVKEVEYGETCGVSKMTSIKVFFNESETTSEAVAASVKEQKLSGNCEDGTKCDSKTKVEKKS